MGTSKNLKPISSADFGISMSCRYLNGLQKYYWSFSFSFYIDLYEAIVNHDIMKAEDVC